MNLTDAGTLQRTLARHGLRADKALGQHFLVSQRVVDTIVIQVHGYQGALEIGPGPGVLTQALCSALPAVIALELDERMIPMLAETAPAAQVLRVDALTTDIGGVLEGMPEPRAIVSNLPYYITGPLLDRIFQQRQSWSKAVLMMQREVGEKILAPVGDRRRGALSVISQALFQVSKVCSVPPGAFLPPPKVESIVLSFEPLGREFESAFFNFVHAGFTQPRKTLANNLKGYGITPEAIAASGLKDLVRPHELELEDWTRLWEVRKS
ncbi:MAG: 16S rRNA (adenine(1518)-N(6)/adenine(1519)-N(6))-dimethyltransferase RsmA [Fimbriimonadaceae bacterium]